jgi:hypothetical protein
MTGYRGTGGSPLVNPPRFKPKQDRRVNARIVPCPTCKAEVDAFCVSSTGHRVNHPIRRRMAIRKMNEES